MPSATSSDDGSSLVVAVSKENQSDIDGDMIICVIRNYVNVATSTSIPRHTLNIPVATTASQFIDEVARVTGYMADTISIQYDSPNGQDVDLRENISDTLECICSPVSGQRCHYFDLIEISGVEPKQNDVEPTNKVANNWTTWTTWSTCDVDIALPLSYSDAVLKSQSTGYVGLVNQAMTCYLNSLIQTLYMTPEFRNAIYRWEFDGSDEEMAKSIPYQLQKLFLTLQTTTKRAVETTELTRSFGWHSSEAWQQHDVQELCRVMFDALELRWKNTDQATLINRLYQGMVKDYVKCLECGTESVRMDAYLDIPLVIRPFGSTVSHSSVEEAMRAFIQPETLDGSNQYFCEKCGKKCDAHKGLKFVRFPYLLTLQMKRFDFDYSTMHRIKLNDRLSFPEILDLNGLITPSDLPETHGPGTPQDCTGNAQDCTPCGAVSLDLFVDNEDEGIDVDSCNSHSTGPEPTPSDPQFSDGHQPTATGPCVFELFSIMVHSGSAIGGHYYAYIKSFTTGIWYSFNDQNVSQVSSEDIQRTYGGSGFNSSTYSSSTNAYMLMYRQKAVERNADFLQPQSFSPYLQQQLQRMKDKQEEERLQQQIEQTTLKIKVFYMDPETLKKHQDKLCIHEDRTLREATETVYELFALDESVVPLDCCRLVHYDDYIDSLERSYDGQDEGRIGALLGGVKQSYTFSLMLQTRRPGEQFQEYRPGGVTVTVLLADLDRMEVLDPVTVRAYQNQTVAEFKHLLSQELGHPEDHMTVVLEPHSHDLRLLNAPNRTLKSEGFFRTNRVFVDVKGDVGDTWNTSLLHSLLQRYQNTVRIEIEMPSQDDVVSYEAEVLAQARLALTETDPIKQQPCDTPCRTSRLTHPLSLDVDLTSYDVPFDGQPGCRITTTNAAAANLSLDLPTRDGTCGKTAALRPHPGRIAHGEASSLGEISARLQTDTTSGKSPDRSFAAELNRSLLNEKLPDTCDASKSSLDSDEGIDESVTDGGYLGSHSHSDPCVYLSDSATLRHASSPVNCPPSSVCTSTDSAFTSNLNVVQVLSGSLSDLNKLELDVTGNSYSGSERTSPSPDGADDSFTSLGKLAVERWNPMDEGVKSDVGEDWGREVAESESLQETIGWHGVAVGHTPDNHRRDCYMSVVGHTRTDDSSNAYMVVDLDRRIELSVFKDELHKYVNTIPRNFKVYRVGPSGQETECSRLNTNLNLVEDRKVSIKLGRALNIDEYLVQVYQLKINEPEPVKMLCTEIFAKEMSVMDSKRLILRALRRQNGPDVSLDRCRLRKKNSQNVAKIYLDNQTYHRDIAIFPNWEVFIQILDGPDPKVSVTQLVVFAKHWRPSVYKFGEFEEIVLENNLVTELRMKLSQLSDISLEHIKFAKGRGTFPCHANVLTIDKDLDWNPQATSLNMWPLYIIDDGSVIYYRDGTEALGELSKEQRQELTQKEARLSSMAPRTTYLPRKEKALKIYTDHPQTPRPDPTDYSFVISLTLPSNAFK